MNKGNKNVIALIPARGGSKRVERKNVRELNGKPLIAYTIEAALAANNIDRVIVSTDDKEIAEIALKYGAEVPFIRPIEISGDNSTEFDFHKHAYDFLVNYENYYADVIVNLYPTTPFRKSTTIDEAVEKFINSETADSLRSVRKCKEHPYKMWTLNGDMLNRFVQSNNPASQTLSYHLLPEVYIQNASIYISKTKVLNKYNNTLGESILYFEMDEIESIDINYELDFEFTEYLIAKLKLNN